MYAFFKPAIIALVLWLIAFSAFSQVPDISYTTPNVYVIGTQIPALSPSNAGGAVPATIYGDTKVIAGTGQFGNINGDAATAQFKLPFGISIDASGNIYIAESGGGIRMISAAGQVSSIGTDALPGPPFNVPKLNNPRGVVKDKSGNLFVANYSNHNILKITPSGIVTVFAGINQNGTADGPGNVANIINPNGIAIDKDDNLYVSDGNNAIRKISPSGYVYTLAGQPSEGTADGLGNAAKFKRPAGLAVDNNGNIYVADQGGLVIRKITPNGLVTTIAGSGIFGTGDGNGAAANFQYPVGITVDLSGNLYVTDGGIGTVRRISPDGEVKTIAGGGPVGVESGVGTVVHFGSPSGIAIGPDGNLYVAEYDRNSIKKVTATGYTIDKALPAGLSFDPRTGTISGTPTVLWPATNYTVTAYNASGSSKFVLSIEVDDVPKPVISNGDVSGAITACEGSASVNYQMFTVSGINLTNDGVVIAPANFEVSLTPVGGYSSTVTISLADLELPPDGDGISVYVRSVATAPAGNLAGDVLLKSTGAADVYVPVSGVVNPIMTLEVSVNQQILACPGGQVILVALTPNPANNLNYQWYVNGNPQGSNSVNFISSEISSTDLVTVKLTNTVDCTSSPSVTSAPVSPMYIPLTTPEVTVEQPDLACSGQPVIFVANTHDTEGANSVYNWQINNIDQNSHNKTFPAPSTITAADKVTVTMINPSDCGPLSATSAPVSPIYNSQVLPIVTVEQPDLACSGQPVIFMANTHGTEDVNSVYNWQINNIDQDGHSKTFPAPATITAADKVTVTMINSSNCGPLSATSVPVSPVYNSQVPPIVTVEQPDLACPGQAVIFVANTHGTEAVNSVYNWQINNVDQINHNKTFPAPATITAADNITVTLINSSNCGTLSATSAPVSPAYNTQLPLTVTISAPPVYPVCEGNDQTFTAVSPNSGNNPNYQWQLNHVNVGENKDKFTSNTLKNGDLLTCTISSTAQCTIPGTSNEFVIQTKVLPTVVFNGDVTIKKGEGIILSPVLSNDVTDYSWSPSVGLSNSSVSSPIASPTETTTYTLTVTAGGCPASATIKVNVLEQMVIPNAFSPNGDGVNDTWIIAGLAAYPNCTVNVFNRYGAGIFRSVGYAKNWNGSFNGYVLPSGTYYYVVDLKNGSKPLSGYVVLLK
ncbi:gliding motility-associated C-terminal domain-containing protein [Mucilaginibacter sp. SMC90]|uniref:T9SS type B sorting domain-containing protein n=1 Tax=Mucilaginibacter sp. SMC90 TaxID=2929803 RepID=UPI001FB3C3C3|nr:gliding motility-associated C-terminal domain-containing protein [Mucilaginibacter sp. SMC90]UOE51410.1 gliding motility-associated C-terminal domain-containing protein [Mucilaginibacter sp. SMC90]